MTKVHLVLHAGQDNRAALLRDTVRVCTPFFKTIQLVDTGSTDETPEVARLAGNVNYKRLEQWGDFWPAVYMELAREIPEGDWMYQIDSDERPPPNCLYRIGPFCDYMDSIGSNCALTAPLLHLDGNLFGHRSIGGQHEVSSPEEWLAGLPANYEQHCHDAARRPWTKVALHKKTPCLHCGNFGSHAGYQHAEYRPHYDRNVVYNHYKTASQICQSAVLCSWSNGLHTYAVPEGSPEIAAQEKLRHDHKLLLTKDLLACVRAQAVPPELLALWRSWEHSPYDTCRNYYRWAFEYGFTAAMHRFCGRSCCRYGDVQL